MFAGPNGSGKSTLKTLLRPELLGVYLNPDEMERDMQAHGGLNLATYRVTFTTDEVREFFRGSKLLSETGLINVAEQVIVTEGRLLIAADAANSYVASVTADLFRQHLLAAKTTFTLETVMSHRSKVELLQQAQAMGFRTYLYFVATGDPLINIARVRARVRHGGHAVPEDRIVKRYHASLALLMEAMRHADRAYIFDNSGEGQAHTWVAEVTEGRELEWKTDKIPVWFARTVWEKAIP
jgi:predicted ABC-type ATPase